MAEEPVANYDEITLGDLLVTLWKGKYVLLAVLLLTFGGAASYTLLQQEEYSSSGVVVPLDYADIQELWLSSRETAILVVEELGTELSSELFPNRWDTASQTFPGGAPTSDEVASKLQDRITINRALFRTEEERSIRITVEMPDPILARDVANAYLATLEILRPTLVQFETDRNAAEYFDGDNSQEAKRQAENLANEKTYYFVVQRAFADDEPISPNVTLNLALGVVLGLMLGVFTVFVLQYAKNFRAERKAIQAKQDEPKANPDAEKRIRFQ